jgi:hypothetical protein
MTRTQVLRAISSIQSCWLLPLVLSLYIECAFTQTQPSPSRHPATNAEKRVQKRVLNLVARYRKAEDFEQHAVLNDAVNSVLSERTLLVTLTELTGEDAARLRKDLLKELPTHGDAGVTALCTVLEHGASSDNDSPLSASSAQSVELLGTVKASREHAAACLASALQSSLPARRLALAAALGSVGTGLDHAAVALGRLLLDDPDSSVRDEASLALGKIGEVSARVFASALSSPSTEVRLSAIKGISNAESKGAAGIQFDDILHKTVLNDQPEVRFRAALALANRGSLEDDVLSAILEGFASYPVSDRQAVAAALSHPISLSRLVESILVRCLAEEDDKVRTLALQGMVTNKFSSKTLMESALPLLKVRNPELQKLLQISLAGAGTTVVDPLRLILSGDDSVARFNATSTLALMGPLAEPCIPDLIRLATNGDFDTASVSINALHILGYSAIEELSREMRAPATRLQAIRVAEELGASHQISDLLLTAGSDELDLRLACLRALVTIGPRDSDFRSQIPALWSAAGREERLLIVKYIQRLNTIGDFAFQRWMTAAIRECLRDPTLGSQLLAALDAKNPEARDLITNLASGELASHVEVQVAAIILAARSSPPAINIASFSHLLLTTNLAIRRATIISLSYIPPQDQGPFWDVLNSTGTTRDSNREILLSMLSVLQRVPNREFEGYLIQCLSDKDDIVRDGALSALEGPAEIVVPYKGQNLKDALARAALADPIAEYRQRAIRCLSVFDDDTLAPTFQSATHDSSIVVSLEAIRALARLGRDVRSDLDAIRGRVASSGKPDDKALADALSSLVNEARKEHTSFFKSSIGAIMGGLGRRIPDTRSDNRPTYYGFEFSYPRLAWPPGRFTDRVTFEPNEVGQFKSTVGEYYGRLVSALRAAGYPDPSLYAVPGGFAVATMPERFRLDDEPLADIDRWRFGKLPLASVDIIDYIRRLLLGTQGHFRWLVFYAVRQDFANKKPDVELKWAIEWARGGRSRLPDLIGGEPVSEYICGVLNFEFVLEDGTNTVEAATAPIMPVIQQIQKSGLYKGIFSPHLALVH